jgi:hypothetical protein
MTEKSKPNNHLKSGMAGAAAERRLGINFYSRELQARMAHQRWHRNRGLSFPRTRKFCACEFSRED